MFAAAVIPEPIVYFGTVEYIKRVAEMIADYAEIFVFKVYCCKLNVNNTSVV